MYSGVAMGAHKKMGQWDTKFDRLTLSAYARGHKKMLETAT